MSYSVWLEIDTGGEEPYQIDDDYLNYTYNVAPMFRLALGDEGLRGLHGKTGLEAGGMLIVGITHMRGQRQQYLPLNPENGWGDYEGALDFLVRLLRVCTAHPKATVVVS